jgi:2-polyprenyl-6-hydroxyphenyl methylase/3-demethylubiquinone-9 3-methyltransferase
MISEYRYFDWRPLHTEAYLWPVVCRQLSTHFPARARVFDLGCGNGAFAAELSNRGYQVVGVDPSTSGIAQGKSKRPELDIHVGSGYDDLPSRFGTFSVVVSLEVIEHVYAPRDFARTIFNLLEPGGIAIISTPYHGYSKNLTLALAGKMDPHFSPLKDHGHIKFWSVRTLSALLAEIGFVDIRFTFAGRFYPLSKSMIAIARRPEAGQSRP